MKTILILEDSSKAKYGGGQEISRVIIRELLGKNKVHLFDFAKESLFLKKVSEFGIKPNRLLGYGKIVHGELECFSGGISELILFPFFLILNFFQLSFHGLKNGYLNKSPIFLCMTKKALVIACIYSMLWKCKIIFYNQNLDDRKMLLTRLFELIQRKANVIIVPSPAVMKNLPLKSELLAYPVEIPSFAHQRNLDGKSIIKIAVLTTLIKVKGVDTFIRSFEFLKNKEQTEYLIFGEGPERKNLESLASGNTKIKFMGYNPFNEVSEQIDIVVLPALKPEAFGLCITDALKSGIPVITTDIGAQSELVTENHNGLKVSIGDPATLAEKIDYLIQNPELYKKFSSNALESVKQFDIEIFRNKLLKILT